MREAMIVRISRLEHGGSLFGCVVNSQTVNDAPERNGDGAVDLDCKLPTGSGPIVRFECNFLKDHVGELFKVTEPGQPWTWDNLKKSRGDRS